MKEQDAAHSFDNTVKHPQKNWAEDFSHENGNYQNICIECKELFMGHKRRVICKECANKPLDWEVIAVKKPPEDKKGYPAYGCWLDGKMVGFAECMVKKVNPLDTELTRLRSELQQRDEEIERIKRELVDARAKSDLLNTLLRSNIK